MTSAYLPVTSWFFHWLPVNRLSSWKRELLEQISKQNEDLVDSHKIRVPINLPEISEDLFSIKKSISISIRCDNLTVQSALRLWRGQNHKVQNNNADHHGADINSIHSLPHSVPGSGKKGGKMTSWTRWCKRGRGKINNHTPLSRRSGFFLFFLKYLFIYFDRFKNPKIDWLFYHLCLKAYIYCSPYP